MIHDIESTVELSDFAIVALRDELGLWFDINEGRWNGDHLNHAFLTDGKTFLNAWVTTALPQESEFIPLGSELFLAWQRGYYSRRDLERSEIERIATAASKRFQTANSRDGFRLLSFELLGESVSDAVKPFFQQLFPTASVREMPPYDSKLMDDPETVLTPSNAVWLQLEFQDLIGAKQVVAALSVCVKGIEEFHLGKNYTHGSKPALFELNVPALRVFGRRW